MFVTEAKRSLMEGELNSGCSDDDCPVFEQIRKTILSDTIVAFIVRATALSGGIGE